MSSAKKRASDAYFEQESKRVRETLEDLGSERLAQDRERRWLANLSKFSTVKDSALVRLIEQENHRICNDEVFCFLGRGGRTALQSLELLCVGDDFSSLFMARLFEAHYDATLARRTGHKAAIEGVTAAMTSIYPLNNPVVLLFWGSPRLRPSVASYLEHCERYLNTAGVTLADVIPLGEPSSLYGRIGEAEMFLRGSRSTHAFGALNNVWCGVPAKTCSQRLARLADSMPPDAKPWFWDPWLHQEAVLAAELERNLKALSARRLEVPFVMDLELLDYFRSLDLDEPETLVERAKQLKIRDLLELEMLEDLSQLDPEKHLPKGSASLEAKRDYLKLRQAHRSLGLNAIKNSVAARGFCGLCCSKLGEMTCCKTFRCVDCAPDYHCDIHGPISK